MSPPSAVNTSSYSARFPSDNTPNKRSQAQPEDTSEIVSFAELLGAEDPLVASLREQEEARTVLQAIIPKITTAWQLYFQLYQNNPGLANDQTLAQWYINIQNVYSKYVEYQTKMVADPESCASEILASREYFIQSCMWLDALEFKTAIYLSSLTDQSPMTT